MTKRARVIIIGGWICACGVVRAEDTPPVKAGESAPPVAAPSEAAGAPEPGATKAGESAPVAAAAAVATDQKKHWWQRLENSGTVDIYGQYSFIDPTSNTVKLRSFDNQSAGGLHLNYAEVSLALPANWFGFRVDIGVGGAADVVGASDPALKVNPVQAAWHKPFQQAYVSFLIPVGRGLTLDVGKFVTPNGMEVIESRDNWNYSRGLLFSFAIPYNHTGLRLSIQLHDKVSLAGYLVNGWNAFIMQGSLMRTGILQVNMTLHPRAQLLVNYNVGYSGGSDVSVRARGDSVRHLVDVVGIFKPTDSLSLAFNGDFGYDGGNLWGGIAAYARYQVVPWYAAALRGEYMLDPQGFAIDGGGFNASPTFAQNVWEITVTAAEFQVTLAKVNLMLRLEYRHDESTIKYLDGDIAHGPFAFTKQDSLTGGLMAFY